MRQAYSFTLTNRLKLHVQCLEDTLRISRQIPYLLKICGHVLIILSRIGEPTIHGDFLAQHPE